MAGDISTVEQLEGAPQSEQDPIDTMLKSIREKVELDSYIGEVKETKKPPSIDSQKIKPLVQEVVRDLRSHGFGPVHEDNVYGLHALAYCDLQIARVRAHSSDPWLLSAPEGRVFHVVKSAIDELFPLQASWPKRGELNQAISREVERTDVFELAAKREAIAQNPVTYARNILQKAA